MSAKSGSPTVFTIPPACPFLHTVADGFLGGELVPGFPPVADPLAFADATIFVPTRRSARWLADILVERGGGSAVLPRILPLGALEIGDGEPAFSEISKGEGDETAPELLVPLPPPASSIWRRLQLTKLIKGWAGAVDGALRKVDSSGRLVVDPTEAFRVATSTVDAFSLAGELAGLIDEMLIEGIDWRGLDKLATAEFDDYWRITTTFLSIAFAEWPRVLREHGLIDAAARQIALVDAQAALIAAGPATRPVIAIGSTGTNRATARLLAAIARAPCGAVVLPGLDLHLDPAAFSMAGGERGAGQEPSSGHPQAALARLLTTLGIDRADVREIGEAALPRRRRDRFVAEAMRPADTTELWRPYRRAVGDAELAEALAGVTLIEAADEREEALCLAIAMREVLEDPHRTAALVTPDRDLARRVRGELLRWNVEVLDTGGEPLATRPLGVLARRVAACVASGWSARDLAAQLDHPLASFGRDRDEIARQARLLDVAVLRTVPLAGTGARHEVFELARRAAGRPHAHPAQKRIGVPDWDEMEGLWTDLFAAFAPFRSLPDTCPLPLRVAAHRSCLAAISPVAAADEADALERLFDEMEQDDDAALAFDAVGYAALFDRLAGEVTLRNTARPHPRLAIYGLIEARLLPADLILLGGLDEAIWPPQPRSDPFLNRPMRQDLGLQPPERRMGQTAHDFAMAMGAERVVLSRAAKRGGSPSVPSRFLLRLQALGGVPWERCRSRGKELLTMARTIDKSPEPAAPAKRPVPKPPVALRPTRLSVTQIETLRRDPYAVFAAHVLRLAPLPQLGEELDAGEFGTLMHEALHRFCRHPKSGGSGPERRAALGAILRSAFDEARTDPLFQAFRWPGIEKAMDTFLGFDAAQRVTASSISTEQEGGVDLVLADGTAFRLSARADRLDLHSDGSCMLIDYKTGRPPGLSEVQVGFAPQMTLEAAILRRGGFGAITPGRVGATYLKLGGRNGGEIRELSFEDESFDEVVDRHFEGLMRLLSALRHVETGYPSRPFPKFVRDRGTYDHLARVGEWALSAAGEDGP